MPYFYRLKEVRFRDVYFHHRRSLGPSTPLLNLSSTPTNTTNTHSRRHNNSSARWGDTALLKRPFGLLFTSHPCKCVIPWLGRNCKWQDFLPRSHLVAKSLLRARTINTKSHATTQRIRKLQTPRFLLDAAFSTPPPPSLLRLASLAPRHSTMDQSTICGRRPQPWSSSCITNEPVFFYQPRPRRVHKHIDYEHIHRCDRVPKAVQYSSRPGRSYCARSLA